MGMLKLNLGCGHVQPAGWENVDGSNRAWFASRFSWLDRLLVALRLLRPTEFGRQIRYANLFKRLPWKDHSADCVYLGEVLEHFTRDDGLALLKECYRVLRPGGALRIRVPDNARFWAQYVQEYEAARQKPRAEWTESHTVWVERFFRDICVRRTLLGSYGHYHKWMYDDISLIRALERLGFASVDRRAFHQSEIPDVAAVEARDDLIVEGIKPRP